MNNLQAALHYLEKGFSVIPIRPDKKPFTQWTEFQRRLATEAEIREWWDKWPKANVGIVTGEISGVFVVDCDNEEAYQKIQELLPDNFVSCIVKSPRGYHIYLFYSASQTIGNATGIMPGVDIRGEGGYIIAPPSINAEGKAYSWMQGLGIDEVAPAAAPYALLSALNNNKKNIYKEDCNADQTAAEKLFTNGRRDNDLFHVAHLLTKGGMPADEIAQVLEKLILSWGEKPDAKWISDKIESAKKRDSRKSGDVTKAIEDFVSVTDGYFSVTDCCKALQGVTDSGQTTFRGILHRLSKRGIIEKHGNKDGVYRRINSEIEPLDWQNAETNPLNLIWPFGIHNLVHVFPGNIGVIAGYPNAGKTAFIHNFIRFNQNQHDIHLFSSEGGPEELKMRLSKFDCPLSEWKFKAWERSGDFADVIKPDAVNVIDYLEIHDDFYKVGGMIKAISDKLKGGFALIAIQKNGGRDEGLGGARGLEKPRLYMAMDSGRLKIVKAKSWVDSHNNPNGQTIRFKIVDGCKFTIESRWERSNDKCSV